MSVLLLMSRSLSIDQSQYLSRICICIAGVGVCLCVCASVHLSTHHPSVSLWECPVGDIQHPVNTHRPVHLTRRISLWYLWLIPWHVPSKLHLQQRHLFSVLAASVPRTRHLSRIRLAMVTTAASAGRKDLQMELEEV